MYKVMYVTTIHVHVHTRSIFHFFRENARRLACDVFRFAYHSEITVCVAGLGIF